MQARAAEEALTALKQTAEARASEARGVERSRAVSQADKAMLASQLAAQRRKAAAVAEAADTAAIEHGLLERGAEEAREAVQRLAASKASAAAAKASAQVRVGGLPAACCARQSLAAALACLGPPCSRTRLPS